MPQYGQDQADKIADSHWCTRVRQPIKCLLSQSS